MEDRQKKKISTLYEKKNYVKIKIYYKYNNRNKNNIMCLFFVIILLNFIKNDESCGLTTCLHGGTCFDPVEYICNCTDPWFGNGCHLYYEKAVMNQVGEIYRNITIYGQIRLKNYLQINNYKELYIEEFIENYYICNVAGTEAYTFPYDMYFFETSDPPGPSQGDDCLAVGCDKIDCCQYKYVNVTFMCSPLHNITVGDTITIKLQRDLEHQPNIQLGTLDLIITTDSILCNGLEGRIGCNDNGDCVGYNNCSCDSSRYEGEFCEIDTCDICKDCEDEKVDISTQLHDCFNITIGLENELETCQNFTGELNENLLKILGIVNETNVNVKLILELLQICCNNQCNLTEVINFLQLIIENQYEYFDDLVLLLNIILLNQTENFGDIISILNQITNIQIPEIITLINQMLIINNDNFTIVVNLLTNLLEYQNYTFTQIMELLNIILTQQTLEFDQLTQLINFFISNTNSSFEHVIDLLNILINDETCEEILIIVIQIANGQNISFTQILNILNRLNELDIELMIDFFNNFNQTETTLQIILDWAKRIGTVKWLLIVVLIIAFVLLVFLCIYIISNFYSRTNIESERNIIVKNKKEILIDLFKI